MLHIFYWGSNEFGCQHFQKWAWHSNIRAWRQLFNWRKTTSMSGKDYFERQQDYHIGWGNSQCRPKVEELLVRVNFSFFISLMFQNWFKNSADYKEMFQLLYHHNNSASFANCHEFRSNYGSLWWEACCECLPHSSWVSCRRNFTTLQCRPKQCLS